MMIGFLSRVAMLRHGHAAAWTVLLMGALAPSAIAANQVEVRARYRALMENVADNPFHAPVSLRSDETGDLIAADAYGVIEHPFAAVAELLGDPQRVCDFVSLSINIKACTYATRSAPTSMTWYMGRKNYSEPDPDQAMQYQYSVELRTREELRIRLHAPQGLVGVTDNIIIVNAAAVDGHTLVHFSLSYVSGFQSKMAIGAYLVTLGRNKIGFTTHPDADGNPVPIQGAQGIIERNTMRYYLALQAWLDAASVAAEQRARARIERWYDYAERYHDQLYELPREEYLDNKKRERLNQQALQRVMDGAAKP